MEPLKTYRPLSRSLQLPSGAREQGLAVIVLGLAIAAGFGWGSAMDRMWTLGKAQAPASFAGMAPDGPSGGFRFRGVYLFEDSLGTKVSVLTTGAKPVRTRRDGVEAPRIAPATTGIEADGGAIVGEVVRLPTAQPGTEASAGSVEGLIGFETNPFPPTVQVAYDPADPSVARVIGLEDHLWPGVVVGFLVAAVGVWMRRRRPETELA